MANRLSPSQKTETSASKNQFPLEHVAIIMDGNRRWADKRGLPRLFGHKEGVKTLKNLVKHVGARGLPYLTVYAFSSENWNRSDEEVNYLMELFGKVVTDELEELAENKVRLRFIGDIEGMPKGLAKSFRSAMQSTENNSGLNLQVAINYGSRLEIAKAARQIAQAVAEGKMPLESVSEETVSKYLYTRTMPDPDLIIRTGGEMRLSNYLLWQAAYAELYVTQVLWPEFTPAEFDISIAEFSQRQRRWGGD